MRWLVILVALAVVAGGLKLILFAIDARMQRELEWLKILAEANRPVQDRTWEYKLWHIEMEQTSRR